MAVQRRVNWISQQRVDVPDMRALESAASNDFDQLIQGVITGTSQGYFLRGFNILMAGAIGGAASGLLLNVDPGAILHIASSQSGTVYMVPPGMAPQQLNSATNVIVDGAFAPSAINYVSIEYERFIDANTSAQIYIWNPTTNAETTKNAPRAQVLRFRIKITTSAPPSNYLPVATVTTDSSGNVVDIQDDRWLLGRLATGGLNPDPFHKYSWPQTRVENLGSSTSNSVDPFYGGDKSISTLKEWMDAIMSSVLEIKGTTYWYSPSSAGSLSSLRQDLGNTVVTGKGSIAHGVDPTDKETPTAPGQINWDQPINIRVVGSQLTYSLAPNASTTDITLLDDHCAYVTLVRDVLITPNLIFTNGIAQVQSVGAVPWTTNLLAGDYVRVASGDYTDYYQILSVDSLTQVTLTSNYAGASTGAGGAISMYAFGTYTTSPTPSTNRHIFISTRENVPEGADVFWLFLRTDNGGNPTVYVRFLGAELDNGEDREVDGTTSAEVLKYMGSPSQSAFAPMYVAAVSPGAVPQIAQITVGGGGTIFPSQYFVISTSADASQYTVWFNVNGSGSQPVVPYSNNSLQVNILSTDTAAQVATKLSNAFNTTKDFRAVPLLGVVTVTNTSAGTCNPPANGDLGAPFAVSVTQSGTGQGNFVVHDKDNLTLAIKELDEAIGSIEASLDAPTYDEVVEIVASGATPPTSLNGPVLSGTNITLPNNSREGNIPQKYTVGKGILMVFLNGQFLDLESGAYAEVGAVGAPSDQIQILIQLEVGDELELRLGGTGGGGGGGGAPGPAGPPGPPGTPGLNGSQSPISISTKTGNYTALSTDSFLRANCASNPVTITLPPAGTVTGQFFYMKKVDPTINPATLQAFAAELIDGLNSMSTTTQYASFTVISNGFGWDLA